MMEARSDMPKNFNIPNQPDILASSEHHFSKKGLVELLPGIDSYMRHVVSMVAVNLMIVPPR